MEYFKEYVRLNVSAALFLAKANFRAARSEREQEKD